MTKRAEPPPGDLPAPTKEHLDDCRRCDLWEHATQGVPGEGPSGAKIMLVGEQPGNEEDLEGLPFVGPAGRLLRTLLDEAGLDVGRVYMTNAVKHFSFVLRGKRRIHKTPLQRQVAACHIWLESELVREKPAVIVALGATALAAIAKRRISITDARASPITDAQGTPVIATYHPSAILRAPDHDARAALRATLVADLVRAAKMTKG